MVGARPQFVKLAVICRAMDARHRGEHIIVYTGRHYDPRLSSINFQEPGVPEPNHHYRVRFRQRQRSKILAALGSIDGRS